MDSLTAKNTIKQEQEVEITLSYSKLKDASPHETITRIQDILAKYGITPVHEWPFVKQGAAQQIVYSNKILLNGVSSIGCNGKGTNIEYSLASGLAEVMERIQSCFLLFNLVSTSKNLDLYTTPYDRYVTKDEFLNIKNDFFEKYNDSLFASENYNSDLPKYGDIKDFIELLERSNILYPRMLQLSQYYSCSSKTTVDLPMELILNFLIGSNGFSAGNTIEESLVQAFSEVFERYSAKVILYKDLNMPEIPYEKYSNYSDITNIIEKYNELGVDIDLRDASLGKGLPVVACIATDKNTCNSIIKFGSHPCLQIAIERCLTEISQGGLVSEFIKNVYNIFPEDYFKSFYFNKIFYFQQFCINGHTPFDVNILDNELTWEYEDKTWEDNGNSNKDLLKKIMNLCELNDYDVYIKDLTFLDFPSVHVYIPRLSSQENCFIVSKNNILLSNSPEYIIDILDNLKNNKDLNYIYQTNTLLFNEYLALDFYKPNELGYLIPFIAGVKLKKFDELESILNFFTAQFSQQKLPQELLNILNPIRDLIQRKDFKSIDKHVPQLLDYCYNRANDFLEKIKKSLDSEIFNLEIENNLIELSKLKKSFIEMLKTRKEKTVDNAYLKGFFSEIMS